MADVVFRNVTTGIVRGVYAELREAQREVFLTSKMYDAAKAQFERLKIRGIIDGDIKGKNVDERALIAEDMYKAEWRLLLDSEVNLKNTKHKLQHVQTKVEEIRLLMRVDELLYGIISRGEH
jgi:hypothetical protein